ncbi:carboxymuconolactone decarboxylase family protein [Leucobacter weissii]|uniref:Carboxymuconolactone decarboxylase family protein n=1 Tax=Leucobacter weissii TaxID=1983706 RepID=A0A939MQ10_9MICO|nr:carboxymuconolactone decarboxylase family protein [Leucobacter weissii]MBO1900934.1 carboxymuconolactone decarboxylase family protein [Leucobacter weissii]
MRPFLDRAVPEAWEAAEAFSAAVRESALARGLSAQESEFIKVRASQLNGCAFCLDLHSREARQSGIPQQKLDLLAAWRETGAYGEREAAVLAIAEAATILPLGEEAQADLFAARGVLGDDAFAAAEWVAVAINAFNRVSILSRHPVRPRDAEGRLAPKDPRSR